MTRARPKLALAACGEISLMVHAATSSDPMIAIGEQPVPNVRSRLTVGTDTINPTRAMIADRRAAER